MSTFVIDVFRGIRGSSMHGESLRFMDKTKKSDDFISKTVAILIFFTLKATLYG